MPDVKMNHDRRLRFSSWATGRMEKGATTLEPDKVEMVDGKLSRKNNNSKKEKLAKETIEVEKVEDEQLYREHEDDNRQQVFGN